MTESEMKPGIFRAWREIWQTMVGAVLVFGGLTVVLFVAWWIVVVVTV